MPKPKIGDKVRITCNAEPYYSGYAGNTVVTITPEHIGTLIKTGVPKVSRPGTFCIVDYVLPGVYSGNPIYGNNTWRVGIDYKKIRLA